MPLAMRKRHTPISMTGCGASKCLTRWRRRLALRSGRRLPLITKMIMANDLNKISKHVTQDDTRPGAQSMLHAIGLSRDDLRKPQIGIVSAGWEGNPCNMHLNAIAHDIKISVQAQDLIGLIFHTAGVSDAISMGSS